MSKHPVVKVAFLDVGQGDTIVVSLPETKEAVIVDCADANLVMNYLQHEDIQHIRGLLITHLHLDHYGGAIQFLANVEQALNLSCERVFFHRPTLSPSLHNIILNDEDNHADGETDEKTRSRKRQSSIRNLLGWAKTNRRRYNNLTLQSGISLPLEGILELIHPWEVDIPELLAKGLNNTSGVIKVYGADCSALLTGDIEPFGWSNIEVEHDKLQSDVLKFPHHGAWKSDDVEQILDAVNPSTVVISVGTSGIQYNHPNKHVFEAISKLPHTRLLCTQATSQCIRRISNKHSQIIGSFEKQANQDALFFFQEQRGCPCSGTIILELGDSVRIIQPQLEFHQNEIIKSFYDTHQCNLDN